MALVPALRLKAAVASFLYACLREREGASAPISFLL